MFQSIEMKDVFIDKHLFNNLHMYQICEKFKGERKCVTLPGSVQKLSGEAKWNMLEDINSELPG